MVEPITIYGGTKMRIETESGFIKDSYTLIPILIVNVHKWLSTETWTFGITIQWLVWKVGIYLTWGKK